MMKNDNTKYPAMRLGEQLESNKIMWGFVVSVNPESQTMRVSLPDNNFAVTEDVPINNMISYGGAGIRIMPVSGHTVVVLLKAETTYIHIGYAMEDMKNYTENKLGSKKPATVVLQRYLEEGEAQMVGFSKNEIFLSNSGSVLLKTADNNYLKLDNTTDSLDGLFRSMKFEMDGVRVRGGRARRQLRGYGNEDVNMVITEDDEIKQAIDLKEDAEGNIERNIPIQEFSVSVGVQKDITGIDKDFIQTTPETSSPSVGLIAMSNRVLKEDGKPMRLGGQYVNFIVKTAGGGGFAVCEDNSAYILDYRGKNPTKISSGTLPKALRSGEHSYVQVSDTTGVEIKHKHAEITIKDDPDHPEYSYTELKSSRGDVITIGKMGITIQSDASLNLNGKSLNINAENTVFGSIYAATPLADSIIKGAAFAMLYDNHIHEGPVGPPKVAFQLLLIPFNPLGGIKQPFAAQGITIG